MIRRLRRLSTAVGLIGLLSVLAAASASAAAPEVTTETPTQIGSTYATFHGTLNTEGHKTTYTFAYADESEIFHNTGVELSEGQEEPFSVSATARGLEPNSAYVSILGSLDYVVGEITIGEEVPFTTPAYHPVSFEADEYPVEISGEGETETVMTFGSQPLTCGSTQFSGSISAAASPLSLEAAYSGNCRLAATGGSVGMNSCHYELGVAGFPFHTGSLGVACAEEGDSIQVKLPGCTIDIPAQSPGGVLDYENSGASAEAVVGVSGEAASVKYTVTDPGFCALFELEEGEHEDGTIAALTTLSASGEEGAVGLFESSGASEVGLQMIGEESEEEAEQPRLDAAVSPVAVLGEGGKGQVASFGKQVLTCDATSLAGLVAEDTNSFALGAQYSGKCVLSITGVAVDTNSCGLAFGVDNSGPPYVGSLGVACDEEGDSIQIKGPGCTIDIPAQSPSGKGLTYENGGEGVQATVDVSGSASSVKYTVTEGGFCPVLELEEGEHEDGTLDLVPTTLSGIYAG